MTRPLVHPVGFMCRTINSRRTEGKLGDRGPAMFRPMATLIARPWGAGLTVLAALVAAGCAVNPATGSRQLMLISESQEIAMGREYDQQVAASIGLYPDSALHPGPPELRGGARRRGGPRDRPRDRAPLRQPDEQAAARADRTRRRHHREPGVRAL